MGIKLQYRISIREYRCWKKAFSTTLKFYHFGHSQFYGQTDLCRYQRWESVEGRGCFKVPWNPFLSTKSLVLFLCYSCVIWYLWGMLTFFLVQKVVIFPYKIFKWQMNRNSKVANLQLWSVGKRKRHPSNLQNIPECRKINWLAAVDIYISL